MSHQQATVFIIDDEPSIRTALERLCRSAGYAGRSYESVDAFLESPVDDRNACVVSDIRMAGTSGLDLPVQLHALHRHLPVIFLTAFDTADTRSAARQAGAAGYFRKPVDDQALLDAIEWSLSQVPRANEQ